MSVTIKDVADRAQVTPAVVSSVLNNRHNSIRVSPATAERVRRAAVDLNYRVNVWARNFRAQQTMTIGVLNGLGTERPSLTKGPRYFSSLMDGIIDGAFAHGYSVTLCPQLLGEDPSRALNDGRFDGLIWYSISPTEQTRAALDGCPVPIVIIHARAASFGNRYATVSCDNASGIGLAVDHLVGMGHRDIAFAIEGDALNVDSIARLNAYRAHMHRHGLRLPPDDVLDMRRDRVALHDYLRDGPRHTAVIVHADGLAADMIRTAPQYGVRIPEDLSVIGFDSTDFCEELRPSLTSVSQPLIEMGGAAAHRLVQSISGTPCDPLDLVLPCGLDVRGSTTSAH